MKVQQHIFQWVVSTEGYEEGRLHACSIFEKRYGGYLYAGDYEKYWEVEKVKGALM